MTYTCDTRPYDRRLHAYRTLTSQPLKGTLALALLGALAAWSASYFLIVSLAFVGLALIFTAITAATALILTFGLTYYPHVPPPRTVRQLLHQQAPDLNVARAASFTLLQAISHTARAADKRALHRTLQAVIHSPHCQHALWRLQFDPEALQATVEAVVMPQLTWETFADGMLRAADAVGEVTLHPEHALGALLLHGAMQKPLRGVDLTEQDVLFVLWWGAQRRQQLQAARRWWAPERLLSFTGIGLSWASGFTPFVDQFARLPHGNIWDSVLAGHEEKVTELINALARLRQSNVLVVGDPGVGRIGLVRELGRRVARNQAHPQLNGQRLLYLNLGELLAFGGSDAGQLAVANQALREMERAGNIIAVVDGLSAALGASGEHRINLTDILLPFLSSATVRVVVMISTEEYHLRIKSNQELIQHFDVVQVLSLSPEATMRRLALTAPGIERRGRIFLPYKTVRAVVQDTASIYPHVPFPKRAYDFLDEAIVLAQNERSALIEPRHIYTVIKQKIGINLGTLQTMERERLLSLEQVMHERLINQERAVSIVARALIRARTEVRSTKRPIGSFLFLGPTGVGKTETAKTLAEVYFGSEDNMVRLDMSEFQGEDAVSRLIGSAAHPLGRLTTLIADHPFTVLLLDEFEKASAQVHQLFLQVLDEGHLTDAAGHRYSFLHVIIIATSNAGAELIRQQVKKGHLPSDFERTLAEHILSQNLLRPELLNRFDAVVTYIPLSKDHLRQIAQLMLRHLNQRLDQAHGLTVAITDELLEYLVQIGYDPQFGARPMNRAIQDTVEYAVAQKILKNQADPGTRLSFAPAELETYRARSRQ